MRGRIVGAGTLGRLVRDGGLAVSLVRDYWKGAYRGIPLYSLLALILALLYIFDPVDLIPDMLPIVGLVDDAVVAAACFALLEKDLRAYEDWKRAGP